VRHSTRLRRTHGSETADTNADAMPLELLERDHILATVMPGHGGDPGGDEAEPDDDTEGEEPEGDPS